MGKDAGEAQQQQQQPPDGAGGGGAGGGAGGSRARSARRFCCCGGGGGGAQARVVRLQCVAALVLGVAVLLSALFWLPPFAGRRGGGKEDPDPGDEFGGAIVASFRLHKTVPELNGNKSQLELDIYEEVGIPNSTVVVNTVHPLDESNWTNIIFNIVPFPENVTISSTSLSILRSKFMSLVVRQSTIHLTEPLFGNSSSFEVIKFPGGITIIPPQTAFLLQKPHATFNFTLNYPIYKLQDRTNELKDQMKAGLLLNPYENLYIKLTNSQGSTILPPTIVETSIVLEVGNQYHQPSLPRMKQLARTITNSSSSSGNLGLNHTVFGRVKQISLSSYLRHSLHSGGGSDAPSPAPMHHHGHHGHHHHHHSHDDNRHPAPAPALAPIHFPMPQPRYGAPPPSGCPYSKNKPKKRGPVTPAAEPAANDHRSPSIALPPHPSSPSPASRSRHGPSMRGGSPVPPPPALPEPPLPTVSFAHPHPPSERGTGTSPAPSEEATRADPAGMSQVAPAPHSSYATRMQGNVPCCWAFFVLALFTLTSLL